MAQLSEAEDAAVVELGAPRPFALPLGTDLLGGVNASIARDLTERGSTALSW